MQSGSHSQQQVPPSGSDTEIVQPRQISGTDYHDSPSAARSRVNYLLDLARGRHVANRSFEYLHAWVVEDDGSSREQGSIPGIPLLKRGFGQPVDPDVWARVVELMNNADPRVYDHADVLNLRDVTYRALDWTTEAYRSVAIEDVAFLNRFREIQALASRQGIDVQSFWARVNPDLAVNFETRIKWRDADTIETALMKAVDVPQEILEDWASYRANIDEEEAILLERGLSKSAIQMELNSDAMRYRIEEMPFQSDPEPLGGIGLEIDARLLATRCAFRWTRYEARRWVCEALEDELSRRIETPQQIQEVTVNGVSNGSAPHDTNGVNGVDQA